MANDLRSIVSLYSFIILSRKTWNSPIRSLSFFRWLLVILILVRSVGVPSSHPFTFLLAALPLSRSSSFALIDLAILLTCAMSLSIRSRMPFIACALCTPLLSSFASWSFTRSCLILSMSTLIFSTSSKNFVRSCSPPKFAICVLGPLSRSSPPRPLLRAGYVCDSKSFILTNWSH